MARRRSSPLPFPARDHSVDEEDDLSNSSADDLFLEEEDPQSTLQPPQTLFSLIWSKFRPDPHAPQPGKPLSRRQAKRQLRRKRRADRRARRRGHPIDDESSTLYDANGLDEEFRDEDDPEFSGHDSWEKTGHLPGRKHRRGSLRLILFAVAGIILVVAVVLMTIRKSKQKSEGTQQSTQQGSQRGPIAKPEVLRNNGTSNFGPTTILISLDGFRADFLDLGLTPRLSSFISDGVSPKYMLPSFPSVTFPNHWTLVTGLYPESHGVVGNIFWDDELGEQFKSTNPAQSMFPKWWQSTGAEPLWGTAEKQGIRSAVHMWPGSEAGLKPEPSYIDKYNGHEPLLSKVERVLGWLDLPSPFDTTDGSVNNSLQDPRPQFISMYVPNVDSDGHSYGPNSTEVRSTLKEVDDMLAQLLSGIGDRNLTSIVNVVVVSDHGMATLSRDRLVQYEDLVDPKQIAHIDGWPLYGLRPKPEVDVQQLYSEIKAKWAASGPSPGWSVYNLETMPSRWHFTANHRIAPIYLVPDAGWAIVTQQEMNLSDPINANAVYHPLGIHGYDNEHPLMRAIFVAKGPAFPHPPGSQLKPFQNVEVYRIVCESLGVKPMAHNGTLPFPLSPEVPLGVPLADAPHGATGNEDIIYEDNGQPSTGGDSDDDLEQIPPGSSEEPGQTSDEEDAGDELEKAKSKLQSLWDEIRQGFDKVKGWIGEAVGGKVTAPG